VAKRSKKSEVLGCPVLIKPDAKKPGICFRIEKVQRDKKKGHLTSFYLRSTGRFLGYSDPAGACRLTRDPFRAAIRPQPEASKVGRKCAKANFGKKK